VYQKAPINIGSFKPEINKKSQQLVEKANGTSSSVVEKLLEKKQIYMDKLKELKETLRKKEEQECTFIPKVNPEKKRPQSAHAHRRRSPGASIGRKL